MFFSMMSTTRADQRVPSILSAQKQYGLLQPSKCLGSGVSLSICRSVALDYSCRLEEDLVLQQQQLVQHYSAHYSTWYTLHILHMYLVHIYSGVDKYDIRTSYVFFFVITKNGYTRSVWSQKRVQPGIKSKIPSTSHAIGQKQIVPVFQRL